jgi:hypothetical protein
VAESFWIPNVRTKLAQLLIAFALVTAVGGHWAILQSVAWLGMVVTYSQDAPFVVALEKTFDGEHPCSLCKAVASGKKTEKRQAAKKSETKLDLFRFAPECFLGFPLEALRVPEIPVFPTSFAEAPPLPPPRCA